MRRISPWLIVCILLWLFFLTGEWISIDFGIHWDEIKLLESIRQARENGNIFPGWYNYPSFCFDVGLVLSYLTGTTDTVSDHRFLLLYRGIFIFLSSLGGWAIWNSLRSLGTKPLYRLIGAAFYWFSFEIGYHARWAAPDVVMASFLVFCMSFLLRPELRRRDVILAAVFLGLAISTKYNAALFAPFFLLRIWLERSELKEKLVRSIFGGTVAVIAALIFTPALLLRPGEVKRDFLWEQEHYSTGHRNYTVNGLSESPGILFDYVTGVMPSSEVVLSWIITVFILAGLMLMLIQPKKNKNILLILFFLLTYSFLFSTYHVWFARNYILIWLVLCVILGYVLYRAGHNRLLRWLSIIPAAVLLFNVFIFARAVHSIRQKDETDPAEKFVHWVKKNYKEDDIVMSALLRERTAPYLGVDSAATGNYYAFILAEADLTAIPANVRGRFLWSSGPDDINSDYYPTWPQAQRIVVVKKEMMEGIEGMKF